MEMMPWSTSLTACRATWVPVNRKVAVAPPVKLQLAVPAYMSATPVVRPQFAPYWNWLLLVPVTLPSTMDVPPPGPVPFGDRVSQNASVPDWKVAGRLMLPLAMVRSASVTVTGLDNGVWSGMRCRVACTVAPAVSQGVADRPLTVIVVVPVWPLLLPIRTLACAALWLAAAATAMPALPLVAFTMLPVRLA